MQGVPEEVVKRAAIVLDAFESNNNVDKLRLDKISSQDQAFKVFWLCLTCTNLPLYLLSSWPYQTFTDTKWNSQDAVDKFMEFDISKGDIRAFFQDIFTS